MFPSSRMFLDVSKKDDLNGSLFWWILNLITIGVTNTDRRDSHVFKSSNVKLSKKVFSKNTIFVPPV